MKFSAYLPLLAMSACLFTPAATATEPTMTAKPPQPVVAPEEGRNAEFANFLHWEEVSRFIAHMNVTHGFAVEELQTLFQQVRHIERAQKLVMPPAPGKPKNWQAYRARFVEPVRIKAGVEFWNTHAEALQRAHEKYGIPPEIIVAIIGVETVYGRHTGNFRVVDVLTTLGFDYPQTPNRDARMRFFRGELENMLLYARKSGIAPLSLLGSYAGAVGWPQFMPGSILNWGVDFDGDGKVDLLGSPVDAIGSIANFLVQHGWTPGAPIVFPVAVKSGTEAGSWESFIGQGLEAKFSLEALKNGGVQPRGPAPEGIRYGLVDLQNGFEPTEYWLGADNFFAITKYNRSFFYAMSVVELARTVRTARGQ